MQYSNVLVGKRFLPTSHLQFLLLQPSWAPAVRQQLIAPANPGRTARWESIRDMNE